MKPFTGDATCPKCEIRYHAHIAAPKYCNGTCESPGGIWRSEHFHCTCKNCGYEWLMECADAKSAVEQLKEDELNSAPATITVCCPACLASISYWLHDGKPSLKGWGLHTEQQP